MKGGIAAMVVAAEALARSGALRGDVVVCTNTDEECGGGAALACARHGVSADYAIVPEPPGSRSGRPAGAAPTAPSPCRAARATPSRSTPTSAAAAP